MGLALLSLLLPTTLQPVLADETKNITGTSGDSIVSYTVGQKYKVTIPTTIVLTDQAGTKGTGTGTVTIHAGNDLKIGNGETLAVAIKAGERLKLGTDGDAISETTGLPYAVSKGSTFGGASVAADGAAFVSADAGATTDVPQALYIESAAPKLAGTYTGTLTFTVNVSSPAFEVSSTVPGTEFTFAGSDWRILATDIDASVPGNQALIIKKDALSEKEMSADGETGADTAGKAIKFHESQSTYFNSNGDNGYEHSLLKSSIDNYYDHFIANHSDTQYVQAVSLNTPTLDEFNTANSKNWSYDNANGSEGIVWYKDTHFKTTLGGSDYAFALSYGDINTTMGLSGQISSSFLNFADTYWLRSSGGTPVCAGFVSEAVFTPYNSVDGTRLARPALVINIKQAS
ncbi:MAG: hypothetical protein LBS41_00950 [Streptococcaceae bacterium]|jgi:hypothetical protein|nr:hypothetical protein [Streptococcaceae bacterium]